LTVFSSAIADEDFAQDDIDLGAGRKQRLKAWVSPKLNAPPEGVA